MSPPEQIETVIVGGGQGGLATSYYLTQHGYPHLILEQAARAAHAWRDGRWDSFTLVTPNWMIQLPGGAYQGNDPDGFMPRDEVVEYLEGYIRRYSLPIRYGSCVTAVDATTLAAGFSREKHAEDRRYLVQTETAVYEAANVVIATGLYQQPKIPSLGASLPLDIHQIHSSAYRNPDALPPGAVLVVGSGQSGGQIAEELYQSGRQVYLCVGSAVRVPRHYRGKDAWSWQYLLGNVDTTVDRLPSPHAKFEAHPQLSGKDGGHTLNLHQFAHDGVILLGHLQGVRGSLIILAADLHESLATADAADAEFRAAIDRYIELMGLDVPREDVPELRDSYSGPELTEVNLQTAGISTVVWATGYHFDFSFVRLPVCDADGYPVQTSGVTRLPGLYFVGLPWLHSRKSGLLFGVGQDAAWIANDVISQRSRRMVGADGR